MKRNSIHFRAGDLRPGTSRRRHQAPWRNVSEMSETSKQWSHPGSASVAQQVPAFPLKGGCHEVTGGFLINYRSSDLTLYCSLNFSKIPLATS